MQELAARIALLEQHNQALIQQLQQQQSADAPAAPNAPAAAREPKLPRPEKWDGKGDMLTKFEIPVRRYLQHYQLQDSPAGVDHALSYLPPDLSLRAEQYWRHCEQTQQPKPATLDALFTLIRTWRPQPDRVRAAREKLEVLKQRKGKLTYYNEDFTRLSLELGGVMSSYDLNWRYVHGLQADIIREIDGKFNLATANLGDIMTLANAAEARLRQTGQTLQRYCAPNHRGGDGPTPMEINAINHGGRPFNGTCFNCGKRGHKAEDCRSPRKEPSQRPAQLSKN